MSVVTAGLIGVWIGAMLGFSVVGLIVIGRDAR